MNVVKNIIPVSDYSSLKDAVPMAVSVALGLELQRFVDVILTTLVMPFIAPLLSSSGDWQSFVLSVGPFHFPVGEFISRVLSFAVSLYSFSLAIPIAKKLM